MDTKASPSLGAIYTPNEYAEFLVKWAIQSPTDVILDLGVGHGVFVFAAYKRLIELGCSSENAQHQIYGTEIDAKTYAEFTNHCSRVGLSFPNVTNSNFFGAALPEADAVIGNPPYVRRMYLENVEHIRSVIAAADNQFEAETSRLTDLYVYFLLHASSSLKTGGRLAVLTADSWLTVAYGKALRKHLLEQYLLERLITFDRRVFDNAQVKPVFVMATKLDGQNRSSTPINFIRVRNGTATAALNNMVINCVLKSDDIVSLGVNSTSLSSDLPWGIYFKAAEVLALISAHPLITRFKDIATTYIGVQTLAKEFFVISRDVMSRSGIEPEFMQPLAQSARTHTSPVIEIDEHPEHYVFYCSKSKEELQGTFALQYVVAGETVTVPVRGKGISVTGYQNKERIKKAGRKYWYDLKTAVERRGRAEILIPRLIYHDFTVVWNKARFVPGELFIEFTPKLETDIEIYLAILSSTVSEIMIRSYAQVYGGGTYNINPGQIINVPILDAARITESQKGYLKDAYRQYLRSPSTGRKFIDKVMWEILDFDLDLRSLMESVLNDLRSIATSSKKKE